MITILTIQLTLYLDFADLLLSALLTIYLYEIGVVFVKVLRMPVASLLKDEVCNFIFLTYVVTYSAYILYNYHLKFSFETFAG